MRIISIDPGIGGAIAFYNNSYRDNALHVGVMDMPSKQNDIAEFFNYWHNSNFGYIELIQPRENDSKRVSSAMKLMKNYGICLGACICSKIETKPVKPQIWMSRFIKPGLTYAERKTRLWKIAKQNFPKLKVKKSQADALCLLLYAMNKEGVEYDG